MSRYRYSKPMDNGRFLSRPNFQKIFQLKDKVEMDIIVTKLGSNRLDLLSYQYYGNTKYWYIIALINGLSGDSFHV